MRINAKHAFVWMVGLFFRKTVVDPASIDRPSIRRILVIRPHDSLGDFVLAMPVLQALRTAFPVSTIGVLVRDYFEPIVQHHPCVDEILVLRKGSDQWKASSLLALFKGLRRGWDLAIVLNTVSHSITSDLFAVFSGAVYRLGSAQRPFPGRHGYFAYNVLSPVPGGERHQTELNLDIVRHIGVEANSLHPFMRILPSESADAREFLRTQQLREGVPTIGMHIGAGKPQNRWPAGNFAELASALRHHLQANILAFWGPAEKTLAERFARSLDPPPVLVRPTTLRRIAALFQQCSLIVCNDTGMSHVAAAVGVPVVSIFGPTIPDIWKPIGDHVVAVRSSNGSLPHVRVTQVYDAIVDLVARAGQTHSRHHNVKLDGGERSGMR